MSDALRKLVQEVAEKEGYKNAELKIKPISSGGANYTSVLYEITIKSPGKDDLDIFAKVACLSEELREQTKDMFKVYETERFFYTQMMQEYRELEEENNVRPEDRLVLPKFFGCNAEYGHETIMLENLTAKGFKPFDRFVTLDWDHAAKSVDQLAIYHALSMALERKKPELFANIIAERKYGMDNNEQSQAAFGKMLQAGIAALKDEYKDKVQKFTGNKIDSESFAQYFSPVIRPVLVHGDFRASNLMQRVNEQGEPEIVIIDFQTIFAGCPILDVLYLVFTGTDEAFRRDHLNELLRRYRSSLIKALERLGLSEEIYPEEDFDYEYKKMLPHGLFIGLFTLQIVTVDAEDAPDTSKGGFESFVMKTSSLYAERINGIVSDFIKWGLL